MVQQGLLRRLCHHRAVFRLILFILIFIIFQLLLVKSFQRSREEAMFVNKVPKVKQKPISVYWKHPRCDCLRLLPKPSSPGANWKSSCGQFSDLRGPHQKVVSYSFYGNTNSSYFKGISVNTKSVTDLYDDWIVRVYHNIPPTDSKGSAALCDLLCQHPNLDDCYVGDLEKDLKDLPSKFGMLWRFMVMGDPTVDAFAVRDLDSPVYQREVDAVNEWLASNKTWHIMRDNPMHVTYMLGGMWGAKNKDGMELMQTLRQEILDRASYSFKSYDQSILGMIVWPVAQTNAIAHDSYLCSAYHNTSPWPTQRVNMTFVGDMPGLSITIECPKECRPPAHKDWKYC